MKVYVNDEKIEIFRDCRAIDAILSYKRLFEKSLQHGEMIIRDEWQNLIADDSPLEEGQRIYFTETANPPPY